MMKTSKTSPIPIPPALDLTHPVNLRADLFESFIRHKLDEVAEHNFLLGYTMAGGTIEEADKAWERVKKDREL